MWLSYLCSLRILSIRLGQNLLIRKMLQSSKQQVLGCQTFVRATNWSKAIGVEMSYSAEDLEML